MFTRKLFPTLLALTVMGGVATAKAEITANVTLATDYIFRGVSQTSEHGAIQGGFDYSSETGVYAGIWASNVDFGTESSSEMDYYVGFAKETDSGFGYDLGYIYYDYEGDSEFDYQEIKVELSFKNFGFGVNYSDEYLGDGGPDYFYPHVSYETEIAEAVTLNLHYGYNTAGEDIFEGDDSYSDYSLTVGYTLEGVDLALAFIGTDLDDTPEADDRVVFSISKSF
jgi:uncharacterized protein (TIGR02001 family)